MPFATFSNTNRAKIYTYGKHEKWIKTEIYTKEHMIAQRKESGAITYIPI